MRIDLSYSMESIFHMDEITHAKCKHFKKLLFQIFVHSIVRLMLFRVQCCHLNQYAFVLHFYFALHHFA